jgi:hypothetical protein
LETQKNPKNTWTVNFWQTDLSLTYLLFFLMITVFVIYPITHKGFFSELLFAFFVGLSFLSGIFSVTHKLRGRAIAVGASLLLVIIGFVILMIGRHLSDIVYLAIVMVYLATLAGLLIKEIFSDDEVNIHRLQGAVAVYILFALIFSFAFRITYILDHTSFHFGDFHAESEGGKVVPFEFLYFSFIILTTMGYGEILPVGHYAQSLAMIESLIGVLFPSILISRLVSLVSFKRKIQH